MINFTYKVKQVGNFVAVPASVSIDETQLSSEDLVLVMQENKPEGRFSKGGVGLSVAKIYQGFGEPSFMSSELVSDKYLTEEQALESFKAYFAEKARLEADLPAIIAQFNVEREAKKLAEAEAKRIADEAKAVAYANKLANAVIIEWTAENKAILNLHKRLAILSEVEMDSRFNNWIKRVDSIDKAKENGYCFEGAWINDKTIEIENKNMVFIVAGTSGSRKYATTHYRVVILKGGKLEATDITADSNDAGWALLIRDKVAELLK